MTSTHMRLDLTRGTLQSAASGVWHSPATGKQLNSVRFQIAASQIIDLLYTS